MRPLTISNNQYSEHTVPSSPTTSHDGATDVQVPHQAHQQHNDDTTTTTTTTPTVELRQRLMVADEVYLYKIPPLQTSGGHRAENWNLASPIATCSLLVERRGDCLVLEFRQTPNESSSSLSSSQQLPTTFGSQVVNPIFAQAVIDCSVPSSTVPVSSIGITNESSSTPPPPPQQQQQRKIQHWIEGTIDSSRYFTLRISSNGGREALIGFGFRDRDTAIDLRESLQHYEASMRREYEASMMMMNDNNSNNNDASTISKYTIPKLADGERIHVRTGKSGDDNQSTTKSKSKSTNNSPNRALVTGRPILLKKPPPSALNTDNNTSIEDIAPQLSNELNNHCTIAATSTTSTTTNTQQNDDISNTGSPAIQKEKATGNDNGDGENNDDDDDDWDTEFVSASY